ncbi:MAG: coproporphyrinogen III oxidase family protein [Treponema sp.]|jgi:oxygen-independent coproporphyrinogen-3 oxidase|nr:coproporphyrinogen III oxidase family protein [Treponema sp.]
MEASLYIHVPFCAGKCDYCDFYSLPIAADDPRLNRFVEVLLQDARARLAAFSITRVPTLFIGGGTPSILGPQRMERLLKGLRALIPRWPAEVTVEVNPESADEALLAACQDNGVSRISAGVQTFHPPSRRLVRRRGDGALLPGRLALLASRYGRAFSADLITGLPGQDEGTVRADIERLLAFAPGHVSLYALTVEEGTPLEREGRRLPPADEADRLWITGRDMLQDAGCAQYETSNFALPGRRAAHNIRYWRMENWIGLGPAASSTIISGEAAALDGRRYTQRAGVDSYLAGPPEPAEERLEPLTLMKETFLMGFRYIEGPDEALFVRRFCRRIEDCIPQTLAAWRERGMMIPGKTALNREGLLFLNAFLRDIFGELDAGNA